MIPDLDLAFEADHPALEELVAATLVGGGDGDHGSIAMDPLEGVSYWHGHLGRWLAELKAELPPRLQAPGYSLGLSLTDDASIAELNRTWRHKDGPTDVLAFAAQDASDGDGPMPMPLPAAAAPADPDNDADVFGTNSQELELGDIVISLDTAARQARENGQTLEQELQFLACHGLLHLLGWDHPDTASLEAMLRRQDKLLQRT